MNSRFPLSGNLSSSFMMALLLLGTAMVVDSAASVAAANLSNSGSFVPPRISYNCLVQGADDSRKNEDVLFQALQNVGLISITDIPTWNKGALLQELEECMEYMTTTTAPLLTFDDGTRRRTLATRTMAGIAEPFLLDAEAEKDPSVDTESSHQSCMSHLQEHSQQFRRVAQRVSQLVAARLGEAFDTLDGNRKVSLLNHVSGLSSYTIDEVINDGEHLEHFHCYYKTGNDDTNDEAATIDWHTDQGLMLLFTPGQVQGKTTGGFFIQLQSGDSVEVSFDESQDDLVLMLGDGVNQYVNPALVKHNSKPLRAVPHSLQMSSATSFEDGSALPRVWYGRMVLPPPQALHPNSTPEASYTFADIRSSMIQKDATALSLGCASNHHHARELAEDGEGTDGDASCSNATSSYCWHRCMNHTDYDVSPSICEGRSLSMACVNQEGYLWTEDHHDPAFGLDCIDLVTAEYAVFHNDTEDHNEITAENGDHDGHSHDDGEHSHDDNNHSDSRSETGELSFALQAILCVYTLWIV